MSVVAEPARENGLNLVLDATPPVRGALLQGDAVRLGQVLINLVANAIKFSDHGTITLSVTCPDETANDLNLRFSIKDEGIGISADDKERLFAAFEQGDNSSKRRHGGSGLGLTISDRLVRAMGGAIQVESQTGAGSVFSFEIRFVRGSRPDDDETESAEPRTQIKFSGSHLLLAEDHPLSRELMRQMLSEFDCNVDLAKDGAEAVECARARPYDLILMDIQMPKLDGLEATRAIRQLPGHERTPILAVTANIFVEDREQCFQAGMNGHLTKPLTRASLARALGRWLAESLEPETADDARIGCLDQEKESADGLAATAMLLGAVGQGLTREYILREFLRLHHDDPVQLRAHLADGDIESARKLVHSLEGASAMVGAQKVRAAVAGLGAALRTGMGKAVVDARLAACETELALLEDASPTEL
jgi:CheY-like chemotaxis protein/HPt (histidine-containing phosphotransfer) domain-containing protein/anti-sigma regulatory factor (Ser/Thr protein kinase)